MTEELFTHLHIDPNTNMPVMHSHELHEIYFPIKGNLTFYIGDEILYVEKEHFILIPKGIYHRTFYQPNVSVERIMLTFPDSLFTEDLADVRNDFLTLKLVSVANNILPYLLELMNKIEFEYARADCYKEPMVHLLVTELLIQLSRYKRVYQPFVPDLYVVMQQIAEYISTHYEEPLTLETISEKFHFSRSYLSRRFKEYTGIGMNEYITYVRISNAERLFRETNLSIAQIANSCGFSDSNYFSTVYKRTRGITPRSYLKSLD